MQALILVAEKGGPTMLARIGMLRALSRATNNSARSPLQKATKKYRIVR
jgi:hypothetical protein